MAFSSGTRWCLAGVGVGFVGVVSACLLVASSCCLLLLLLLYLSVVVRGSETKQGTINHSWKRLYTDVDAELRNTFELSLACWKTKTKRVLQLREAPLVERKRNAVPLDRNMQQVAVAVAAAVAVAVVAVSSRSSSSSSSSDSNKKQRQ